MERLRSTRRQRETYVGPWLPEPILTETDAAEDVAVAESVSLAMLVVLETLSPWNAPCSCSRRSSTSPTPKSLTPSTVRSRRYVRPPTAPATTSRRGGRGSRPTSNKKRAVTERFFAATTGGDINELMELLAPDVTLWTDGGGKVRQAMRPIIGAEKVARWLAGAASRPYEGVEIVP